MSKPSKEVVMQGYLEKKSPKAVLGVRAWQKRYFELVLVSSPSRGNELSLFYHKSESDVGKEPLGEIVLNEIKSVTLRKDKGEGRFDVEVPTRVFALKCDLPAELKKWISTLESMKSASYSTPSALGATPAEVMKSMASANKSGDSKFNDAQNAIELMTKGQAFIRYQYEHVTEQTTREIVLLFYKKDATPLGSLYYCEPGEKTEDADGALCLHSLTDLYLGKQSKAFKSAIAAHAESKRCFTAVGSNRNGQLRELNLEGDSKEQVAAWLVGINGILTHKGGRKVMTAEESEKEEAQKRAAAAARAEELKAQQAAAKAAQEEAERAQAAAAAEAERAAAEQRAAESAAEKAAAERSAAEAAQAAQAAQQAAAAAAAALEAVRVAEAARAEALAAAAAATAAAAVPAPAAGEDSEGEESAAPGVVRIRRKQQTGSTMSDISATDITEAAAALVLESPTNASASAAAAPAEETAETWLASLGDAYPSEYSKLFKDNGVDLHFLVGLSGDELAEIGVRNGLHLKKMLAGIEKLRESGKYAVPAKVLQTDKPAEPEAPAEPAAAAAAPAAAAEPVATSEIGSFLLKLGPAFLSYERAFVENGVSVDFLLTLNDDDLEELGVSKLHRKRLVQEIKDKRAQNKMPEAAAPVAPAAPPAAPAAPAASASGGTSGGYLARAQAAKSSAAPAASSSAPVKDDILASIKEAKAKSAGAAAAPPADDFDLSGTSIAAIAARMAAQREERAKAKAAEASS